MQFRKFLFLMFTICSLLAVALQASDQIEQGFVAPPDSARPWVYWFWINGNISKEGITTDLEAMARAGIGGVLIMEVNQGSPDDRSYKSALSAGAVSFGGKEWRELFKYVVHEADRLGLEVNMNSGPGWTGTGGPWITPEYAMQELTWSKTTAKAGKEFKGKLPEPEKKLDFYRDIAVLAFPEGKVIARGSVIDLTDKTDLTDRVARLKWSAPSLEGGNWTILRIGYTPTGRQTRPPPATGVGLECDKLSKQGVEKAFDGFIRNLIKDVGPLAGPPSSGSYGAAGKTFVSTHIDSWEVGEQNWSPGFDDEFKRLRGYDVIPYLPAMAGYIIDGDEVTKRFHWDFNQTISDLICDNYAGHLRALAHKHGMRLSIEAYKSRHTICDEVAYAGRADEPMCEFWSSGWPGTLKLFRTCKEMSSAAHVYGNAVTGAEAFTADSKQPWMSHPALIKSLGDKAFCDGVNRFVFHRYAHQALLNRSPGITMGPWGLHYEHTQTWWEMSTAWHKYLSRCQYMLRQGLYVADICYLRPEIAPQDFQLIARDGYNYDVCPAEVVIERMTVKDGRLVLPDGMSYSILVLPDTETMTPQLLRKLKKLSDGGATIVGTAPVRSPSLQGYPTCDEEVNDLVGKLKLTMSGKTSASREMVEPLPEVDVSSQESLERQWIWFKGTDPARSAPAGTRYFRRIFKLNSVERIKSAKAEMTADNEFVLWVNGKKAGSGKSWNRMQSIDVKDFLKKGLNVLAVEAVNTLDKPNPAGLIGLLKIKHEDGKTIHVPTDKNWQAARGINKNWLTDTKPRKEWIAAMELGPFGISPWGSKPRKATPEGMEILPVPEYVLEALKAKGIAPDFQGGPDISWIHRRTSDSSSAQGYGEQVTDIYFVANGKDKPVETNCTFRVAGKQPEIWDPMTGKQWPAKVLSQKDGLTTVPLRFEPSGSLFVVFRRQLAPAPEQSTVRGKNFPDFEEVLKIEGAWKVEFDSKWGGPEEARFDKLVDWKDREEEEIKYYSGEATYRKTFEHRTSNIERRTSKGRSSKPTTNNKQLATLYLDLGQVEVMASVKLNGKDCGIAWKRPYRVDITDAVRKGENLLEVTVANRWPNRMIGDKFLPEKKRYTWATWDPFTKDSPLLPSGLLGPVQILKVVDE